MEPGPEQAILERTRRRRRRRVVAWLPTVLMSLATIGVIAATVAVNNSWWTESNPRPSADQAAEGGTSVFTDAGLAYIGRTQRAVVDLRHLGPRAEGIGLPPTGAVDIEPPIPVELIVVAPDGYIVEYVDRFTLRTEDGRLQEVRARSISAASYRGHMAHLEGQAGRLGWTAAELRDLEERLSAAHDASESPYSAATPRADALGIGVVAEIRVDLVAGAVELWLTFTTAAAG